VLVVLQKMIRVVMATMVQTRFLVLLRPLAVAVEAAMLLVIRVKQEVLVAAHHNLVQQALQVQET
jgi:hypothetical protein